MCGLALQARAGAQEATRQRRQNGEHLGRVLQQPPSANSRSTKPLTIPLDPHLSTSKRRRLHHMAATPAVNFESPPLVEADQAMSPALIVLAVLPFSCIAGQYFMPCCVSLL